MTTTTNRINYQVGDVPRIGNCGVVAVANATGLPYRGVWDGIKRIARKPGNWKGSTRYHEVTKYLDELADAGEIEYREYTDHDSSRTVAQFARRAPRDRIFMVWTTGHVQVVHGGEVMDQNYRGPIEGYWGRRKFINRNYGDKAVLEIVRLNENTPTPIEPEPTPEPAPAPAAEPTKRSPAIGRHLGIGERIAEMLLQGFVTEYIVTTIRCEFPDSRATARDVSIMRCKLRRDPTVDFE